MNRQEQRKQEKEKEREQRIKQEKSHEEVTEKRRPPIPWLWFVIGSMLVLAVVYMWTVGIW